MQAGIATDKNLDAIPLHDTGTTGVTLRFMNRRRKFCIPEYMDRRGMLRWQIYLPGREKACIAVRRTTVRYSSDARRLQKGSVDGQVFY